MKLLAENAILEINKGKGKNKRNCYYLVLDEMPKIKFGNLERSRGKKKLFIIADEALESVEAFIDKLSLSIEDAAQDLAVERFFDSLALCKGKEGEVAIILVPCMWPLTGLYKVFAGDPDYVNEDLSTPCLASYYKGELPYPYGKMKKSPF